QGAGELRREAAFVELPVALDLVLIDAIELDRRNLVAADLCDDLARAVPSPVRAREEDEPEDEDDDDREQRPLELVEAGAHGFEHFEGSFLRTRDYNNAERDERSTIRYQLVTTGFPADN